MMLGSPLCPLCLQRGLGWLSETRAPLPGPGKTLAQHYQLGCEVAGGKRGLCTDVLLAAAVSTLPVPLAVLPLMGGPGPSVVLVSQPLVGVLGGSFMPCTGGNRLWQASGSSVPCRAAHLLPVPPRPKAALRGCECPVLTLLSLCHGPLHV